MTTTSEKRDVVLVNRTARSNTTMAVSATANEMQKLYANIYLGNYYTAADDEVVDNKICALTTTLQTLRNGGPARSACTSVGVPASFVMSPSLPSEVVKTFQGERRMMICYNLPGVLTKATSPIVKTHLKHPAF